MMSMIINIAGLPLVLLAGLIAASLSVKCFIELLRKRHSRHEGDLTKTINIIPVVAGLMPLLGFFNGFIQMIRVLFLTLTSAIGDPRVVAGGIAQEIGNFMYPLGMFLFFYFVWLVLRVMNDCHQRVSVITNSHSYLWSGILARILVFAIVCLLKLLL